MPRFYDIVKPSANKAAAPGKEKKAGKPPVAPPGKGEGKGAPPTPRRQRGRPGTARERRIEGQVAVGQPAAPALTGGLYACE